MRDMSVRSCWLVLGGVLLLTAVILAAMGRIWICECGYVSLWHGAVQSSQNSQHLTDWYTFSHVIHGIGFFYLLRWLFPKWRWQQWLLAAVLIEAGWEILENTPMVIDHYRTTTISLDYYGDSIINSMADIGAMMIGFWMAARWKWWVVIGLVGVMELVAAWVIRDNLTLNIVMLVWPMEFIKDWQLGV